MSNSLFRKDAVFAPLLKQFIDTALDADMEEHLGESEHGKGRHENYQEFC